MRHWQRPLALLGIALGTLLLGLAVVFRPTAPGTTITVTYVVEGSGSDEAFVTYALAVPKPGTAENPTGEMETIRVMLPWSLTVAAFPRSREAQLFVVLRPDSPTEAVCRIEADGQRVEARTDPAQRLYEIGCRLRVP